MIAWLCAGIIPGEHVIGGRCGHRKMPSVAYCNAPAAQNVAADLSRLQFDNMPLSF